MKIATEAIVVQGTCPHCGQVWAAPVAPDGKAISCPACGLQDERHWATERTWCLHCGHRWLAVTPEAEARLCCPVCGKTHGRMPMRWRGPILVLAA